MVDIANEIQSIEVKNLQGMFNYKIDFPDDSDTIILIAPNGYGKTAFLNLINLCARMQLIEAADCLFDTLEIRFTNGERWLFSRVLIEQTNSQSNLRQSRNRIGARTTRHFSTHKVEYISYDHRGKKYEPTARL